MKIPELTPGDWPALLARARRSPVLAGSSDNVPDGDLALLLQASVTLAWWIQTFAPELALRPALDILVIALPGGPSLVDAGRPYQLLPTLLDRPAMRVSVSITISSTESRLAPATAQVRPAMTLANASPMFAPAALFEGTLDAWWATRGGRAPDLVMLVHPRFDERIEFWLGLGHLIGDRAVVGVLARGPDEAHRDAWLLRQYGFSVAPEPHANPWATRRGESLGQGAWGACAWRLLSSSMPAAMSGVAVEALHRAAAAQRFLQHEYEVWNPLGFIGQLQRTADPDDPDRLVGLPDHHVVSLDTGEVWQVEADALVPGEGAVRIPAEVLATFPGNDVAPFERLLWAVETYELAYRPREAMAVRARHDEHVQELESELEQVLQGRATPAEIAAVTHYYLGGDAPGSVAPEAEPFFAALRTHEWQTAAALMVRDPALVAAVDEDGRTALFHAMAAKYYDFARQLLELGVPPDHLDHEGFAVIHDVAKRDEAWPVQLLQRYGADLNLGTGLGLTPAVLALRYGCWSVLGFLVAAGVDLHKSVLPGTALADLYTHVSDMPRVVRAEIDARLGKRRVIPIVPQAGTRTPAD